MKGGCRLFAIELYKLFRSKYIFAVLSVLLIPLLTAITLEPKRASLVEHPIIWGRRVFHCSDNICCDWLMFFCQGDRKQKY